MPVNYTIVNLTLEGDSEADIAPRLEEVEGALRRLHINYHSVGGRFSGRIWEYSYVADNLMTRSDIGDITEKLINAGAKKFGFEGK